MPVFGIATKKVDERLRPWANDYYTVAANIGVAADVAAYLLSGEVQVHSDLVTIVGAHVWEVGNRGNFTNPLVNLTGELESFEALPPWFTAEVNLTSAGSYPGWKRYRTRGSKAYYTGPEWSSAFQGILALFGEFLDESPLPLTTRSGVPFGGASYNQVPVPLQLSKRWYNRASS